MNIPANMLKPVGPTALAAEPDFELGRLTVSPSQLEIRAGVSREAVQPRVMQVLIALSRANGDVVSRDALIRQCWGGRAVSEDAINRCIAGVRRLGETGGDFSVATVRRVGYRLDRQPSAGQDARTAPPVTDTVVLAVLAFDNLCGDADMSYFSDGVSEEILHAVSRGAELRVIGRGSSFQFRGTDKAASNVAKVLRATHILDGSVRRSGTRVRITASLVECAGETTLWSHRFERELADVFALQDEIASAVAAALKVAFAPTAQHDTVDPAAYDLYLKALEIRNRGLDGAGRLPVIRLLEDATILAPDFARAWVFLATMQVTHLRFGDLEEPRSVTREKAVASAQAALRLDPGLGGAYQALGQLEAFASFAAREVLNSKALQVSPNDPTVLTNASLFFASVGRIDDAVDYATQAYRLEPMYPWAANWYATLLDYTGRLEEGLQLWKNLRALWPDNELICWGAIVAAVARSDWPWFDELIATAKAQNFQSSLLHGQIGIGVGFRTPGPDMRARALKRARERMGQTNTLPLATFLFLYRLGLADETFELIEQASFAFMFDPERRAPTGMLDDGSMFVPIHSGTMTRDIRFVGFCARLGLCDYWVKTGRWPDCAEAVAPYYDFKAEARRLAAV